MGLITHKASFCILIWLFIQVSTSMSEDAFENLSGEKKDAEDTEDNAVPTVATTTETDWSGNGGWNWLFGGQKKDAGDTEDDAVTTVATTTEIDWSGNGGWNWLFGGEKKDAEKRKGLSDELVREVVREFAMLLDDADAA